MARGGTTTRHRDTSPRSAPSPSPSFSNSEVIGSRPGSPVAIEAEAEDSVTCQWDDCGVVFTHLPSLVEHIHNEHIGVHKSNYTCEWATCPRRGLPQTSRYALIGHLRSHTGERPFVCERPECEKAFTRSDALSKHMRLQHNISPPASGRGGSRKRKRGVEDQQTGHPPPPQPSSPTHSNSDLPPPPTSGFSTFKVEHSTPPQLLDDVYLSRPLVPNGQQQHQSLSPRPASPINVDEDEGYTSSSSDTLPAHLMPHYVPATGLVLGRSPSMVMYLLMKAKYKYALEQHESLCEELRVVRAELKKEKEEKEGALNLVLRSLFGGKAEHLIGSIQESTSDFPLYPSAAVLNGHGR